MKLMPIRPSGSSITCDRNVARHQLEAGRQDDSIALDAERPVEDDGVAIAVVALRILVGLDDPDAAFAALRHGPRELDADVAAVETRVGEARLPGLGAAHLLKRQRRARHQVDDRLVGGDAAHPDRVEEEFRPRRNGGDVVDDLERRGLGREQLVARVLILAAVLGPKRPRRRQRCHHHERRPVSRRIPLLRYSLAPQREGLRTNVADAPNAGPSTDCMRSQSRRRSTGETRSAFSF